MTTAETIADARAGVARARREGRTIGLVPTMGALHAGHVSLMDASRAAGDFSVVSIFVNPTQFGPGEDFKSYPRQREADVELCGAAGVGLVFAPSVEEMYPLEPPAPAPVEATPSPPAATMPHSAEPPIGSDPRQRSQARFERSQARFERSQARPEPLTQVRVARLSETLCGATRPGHFDGVALVVAKLFNIIQPDRAYFGQKDAQQLAVIRRMARDLDFPVEVVGCPIVRESDGLAMSSRNVYLTEQERVQARSLSAALRGMVQAAAAGERDAARLIQSARETVGASGLSRIDYISVVDPDTMQPMIRLDRPALAALAVHVGKARLIDNVMVNPNPR